MDDVSRWRGRYLPHWTRPNGTYFLTFRTADSLPVEVVSRLREESEANLRALGRELGREPTAEDLRPLRTERDRRTERHLDLGHGSCRLRDPRVATIVADAIRFFDGVRYDLHAWCLMPNHVHVLLTVCGDRLPTEVAGSWKKFSARRINAALGTSGSVWQEEGFDHLVRGPDSFRRICGYIGDNPGKAGLGDWPWVGGDGRLPEAWEVRDSGESRHETKVGRPSPR